eukprot:TRINITY_DN1703_c1_g3_i3.p1 TRINITY_DN1703_c1_g3~~TRINITY_DN1703_c1_g3_i3.p1  ORF type:complete len:251 (-),score=-24.11 TRINITY_DN1703_c1_g3_i3:377-1129(-)
MLRTYRLRPSLLFFNSQLHKKSQVYVLPTQRRSRSSLNNKSKCTLIKKLCINSYRFKHMKAKRQQIDTQHIGTRQNYTLSRQKCKEQNNLQYLAILTPPTNTLIMHTYTFEYTLIFKPQVLLAILVFACNPDSWYSNYQLYTLPKKFSYFYSYQLIRAHHEFFKRRAHSEIAHRLLFEYYSYFTRNELIMSSPRVTKLAFKAVNMSKLCQMRARDEFLVFSGCIVYQIPALAYQNYQYIIATRSSQFLEL